MAEAPHGLLRTRETIQRFQAIPQLPGQQPALSVYFKHLLDQGKLNNFEAVELARIVLQKQGGSTYIQKLITEEKVWRVLLSAQELAGTVERSSAVNLTSLCERCEYQAVNRTRQASFYAKAQLGPPCERWIH